LVTPRYSWNIAKVGVKHQSINQTKLNKAEHLSLNFVQKRLSNDCVTVSVDVDENTDCVTRSGGETGPGRRWSEFWRRKFGFAEAVSRSCTKLSYIVCIYRAFMSSSTASFQYGCVMTLQMIPNAL